MLNRRRLLVLGGTLGGATMLSGTAALASAMRDAPTTDTVDAAHDLAHGVTHPDTVRTARGGRVVPDQFAVRMPVPRELRPVRRGPRGDVYRVDIQPGTAELVPGLQTPVLTYGGDLLGPTIRATAGRPVEVTFGNKLGESANVHLHGGHVSQDHDGHPLDVLAPGTSRRYTYPNGQRGATLWYHDHTHHLEAEHVYRGLHGFYLIEDPTETGLGLPSGAYDVPIMLRDAEIDSTGALVFGDPANRTVILANGRPTPYFPVEARKYRLRLLNAATHRLFQLRVGELPMAQIASDGGLLPTPVNQTELRISPAERVEIVVDFSRVPVGGQVVLTDAEAGPVMRFDVRPSSRVDRSRVPRRLRALPSMPRATVTRDFELRFDMSSTGGDPLAVINGKVYDPYRVDTQIQHGATEIWNIRNADSEYGIPHSFHLHMVMFRVLDRNGGPALPGEHGLKDTIYIPPGETARVAATFTGFTGRYAYHCHMMEHSLLGMMAQMEIVR